MRKLVLIGTNGLEHPTKAVMPLVIAMGATKAKEPIEPHVALLGDGVVLLKPFVIESLIPVGYPPLRELMAGAKEHRIPLYV